MNTTINIPNVNRLPLPAWFYVKRDEEIKEIANALRPDRKNKDSGRRCLIQGSRGMGKTELCRAATLTLRDEFPDAQIYLKVDEDDSEYISLFRILETIIHIFDPYVRVSDDLETLSNQCNSVLDTKRVLIILDGLQYDNQLDGLTPPPSCGLLITSSVPLQSVNLHTINLRKLSQDKSEELLLGIAPRIGKNVTGLVNVCQNIPLNLCLVSSYLNFNQEVGIQDFIANLEKHLKQRRWDDASLHEAILSYVVKCLSPEERRILQLLSIFSCGFSKDLAREALMVEPGDDDHSDAVQAYLDAFTQLNFLVFDQTTAYYYMQSTIQSHMLEETENVPDAWLRMGQAYSDSMEWLVTLSGKSADPYFLGLLIIDEHKSTVRKILNYFIKHTTREGDQIVLSFLDLIGRGGNTRFSLKGERLPLLEEMMRTASRLHYREQLILILEDLSNIYRALGEKERSLYYSKAHDEMLAARLVNQVESAVEDTFLRENKGQIVSEVEENLDSGSLPPALDKISINESKIVLTGFMGTGKTTIGKLLAENLKYRFIDTDQLIESRLNRSISDIFKELGEDAFREMERAIVRELADLDGVVISTGGRLMLDPENVKVFGKSSRVLCLVATPDEILTRVEHDKANNRPLLSVPNPKERIVELLQERNDQYLRFPQVLTDEKEPIDIASSLVAFVNTSPKSLLVENPQKNYEYIVGAGLLPFLRQWADIHGEVVIITDPDVKKLYGPSCASIGQIVEIPIGRQYKTMETVETVYRHLIERDFDRSGTIIALGGSIVGDIAGYVAATYMRGVNYIQCPTSLIAMVDTSVGGKVGIDLPHGKNLIGVYKQPIKVIADVATLQTLPPDVFSSGMAEVIKHGLIAESSLLDQVEKGYWEKNWDRSPSYIGELQRLVAQAIQVKINIVQADPFEQGQRSILNLGHTFAYALEITSNNAFRHGEAVSMGLVAAINLSARLGFCDISLQKRIETILESVNLPTRIPSKIKPDALLQAMQSDKKKRAGKLRFILVRGIGQAFVSDEVPNMDIVNTINDVSDSFSRFPQ